MLAVLLGFGWPPVVFEGGHNNPMERSVGREPVRPCGQRTRTLLSQITIGVMAAFLTYFADYDPIIRVVDRVKLIENAVV